MASAVALTIAPGYIEGLNTFPIASGPEAATQTFDKGAVLIKNGSGYIAVASADPTAAIVGIAAADGSNASGAGDSNILYYPATPNAVFEVTLADAGNEAFVLLVGNLFEDYALQTDSDKWYLDKADTSNVSMVIVAFKDAAGATEGRVYAKFLISKTIYG